MRDLQDVLGPFQMLLGQRVEPELSLNLGHPGQQEALAGPVLAASVPLVGFDQVKPVAVSSSQEIEVVLGLLLVEHVDGPLEGRQGGLDDVDVERTEPDPGHLVDAEAGHVKGDGDLIELVPDNLANVDVGL